MKEALGLRLHHVGVAVADVDAAAGEYVRRFGYVRVGGVIHDPLQTALVQFLRLDGDSSYLEFVGPDGPASKLSRTAERRGGLHHLCYMVQGLEQAVETLRERGLLLFSDAQPGAAFAGRRICWLMGGDGLPIELVERLDVADDCLPGG